MGSGGGRAVVGALAAAAPLTRRCVPTAPLPPPPLLLRAARTPPPGSYDAACAAGSGAAGRQPGGRCASWGAGGMAGSSGRWRRARVRGWDSCARCSCSCSQPSNATRPPWSHPLPPPLLRAAYTCDPATCTGACHCPSTAAPGGLSPADTPQFVLLTVRGACARVHVRCARRDWERPSPCASPVRTQHTSSPPPPPRMQHDDAVDARANRVVRTVTDGYKVRQPVWVLCVRGCVIVGGVLMARESKRGGGWLQPAGARLCPHMLTRPPRPPAPPPDAPAAEPQRLQRPRHLVCHQAQV